MNRLQSLSLTNRAKLGLLVVAIGAGLVLPNVVDNFILGLLTLSLVAALFAMSVDLMA